MRNIRESNELQKVTKQRIIGMKGFFDYYDKNNTSN